MMFNKNKKYYRYQTTSKRTAKLHLAILVLSGVPKRDIKAYIKTVGNERWYVIETKCTKEQQKNTQEARRYILGIMTE